ncbi:MAG: SUMF1/EgtB/PvdO family nonheme iron enzyme [Planctomycetota bacterium]
MVATRSSSSSTVVARLGLALLVATAGCRGSGSDDSAGNGASVDAGGRVPSTAIVRVDGAPSAPETVSIPGTSIEYALVAVPGGTLRGERVAPFRIATCEVTWDDYMSMVLETEGPPPSKDGTPIDGLARPTKPYIATDRGMGMGKRPVISISEKGAESFCVWLSRKTGRTFRLPTELEWEWACRAGSDGRWSCGDDPAGLDAIAWYDPNSDFSTHVVGTKEPNAWGLHDMHGNVAEWCRDGSGGYAVRGGSYLDDAEGIEAVARAVREAQWNQSDPQIPKSVWWLADASYPGMRVVVDAE